MHTENIKEVEWIYLGVLPCPDIVGLANISVQYAINKSMELRHLLHFHAIFLKEENLKPMFLRIMQLCQQIRATSIS